MRYLVLLGLMACSSPAAVSQRGDAEPEPEAVPEAVQDDASAPVANDAGATAPPIVDAGPATNATVNGTIGGVGLPKAWAHFRTGEGVWAVEISNEPDLCALRRRHGLRAGLVTLGFGGAPPTVTRPYVTGIALGKWSCDGGAYLAHQSGATVDITTLTPTRAAGSFELRSDAGALTGTFDAPFCDVPIDSNVAFTCED